MHVKHSKGQAARSMQDRRLQTAEGPQHTLLAFATVPKASMHLKAVHSPYNADPVVYDMQQQTACLH